MKNVLALLQVLIGLYWLGDLIRQNPKINQFVLNTENSFAYWNNKLKDSDTKSGLFLLKKLFAYLAIIFIVIFFLVHKLLPNQQHFIFLISSGFVASIFIWISLSWTIDHKYMIHSMSKQVFLLSALPMISGIFDYIFSTLFTDIFVQIHNTIAVQFGWKVSEISHPLLIGIIGSVILIVFFLIYYGLMWVISLPTLFIFFTLMFCTQKLAKFIHSIAPQKPLVGLSAILFIILTFVQANI